MLTAVVPEKKLSKLILSLSKILLNLTNTHIYILIVTGNCGWLAVFLSEELSEEVKSEGSESRASSKDWCLTLQKWTTEVVLASAIALEMLVDLCAHFGHGDHVASVWDW